MKNFIIYETSTGYIKRTGSCPDSMFNIQAGDGESILEGTADDVTQMIEDGEIVARPPPAPVPASSMPTPPTGTVVCNDEVVCCNDEIVEYY